MGQKCTGNFSKCHLSFFYLKNPLQAHSANITYDTNQNTLLRKEFAKIKLRVIKKVSKAHLQLEIRKLQMSLPPDPCHSRKPVSLIANNYLLISKVVRL
jgi:hypothetical protein